MVSMWTPHGFYMDTMCQQKKKSTDVIVSIRKRKNKKEAENIRMRLELSV